MGGFGAGMLTALALIVAINVATAPQFLREMMNYRLRAAWDAESRERARLDKLALVCLCLAMNLVGVVAMLDKAGAIEDRGWRWARLRESTEHGTLIEAMGVPLLPGHWAEASGRHFLLSCSLWPISLATRRRTIAELLGKVISWAARRFVAR